jgi:hypothetical protein
VYDNPVEQEDRDYGTFAVWNEENGKIERETQYRTAVDHWKLVSVKPRIL